MLAFYSSTLAPTYSTIIAMATLNPCTIESYKQPSIKFPESRAHSGNSEKFAPRENNPLYGRPALLQYNGFIPSDHNGVWNIHCEQCEVVSIACCVCIALCVCARACVYVCLHVYVCIVCVCVVCLSVCKRVGLCGIGKNKVSVYYKTIPWNITKY